MKVFVKNFGCKTNFADLYSILGRLKAKYGSVEISDIKSSELVILNSCSVTEDAEKELIKWLKNAKKKGKKVIVSGCLPNIKTSQIIKNGADEIIGAGKYNFILNNGEKINEKRIHVLSNPRDIDPSQIEDDVKYFSEMTELFPRHRIYLKVQEGCSRFCTFCSIPLTRGLPRSIPIKVVLQEIEKLVERGFKEIVLVGTHLALFSEGLGKLAKEIAKKAKTWENLPRIRFASLSPGELDDEFMEALDEGKDIFCPHFHISVQSGSNRILKMMRRWHTFEDFLEDARKLLSLLPNACVGTDIIVGFPGESDADFQETVRNISISPVGHIHVFPFSPRPHTPASLMKPVSESIVRERMKVMLKVGEEKREAFITKFKGQKLRMLVERVEDRIIRGTTENYIPTYLYVPEGEGKIEKKIKEGEVIEVRVKEVVKNKTKIEAKAEIIDDGSFIQSSFFQNSRGQNLSQNSSFENSSLH